MEDFLKQLPDILIHYGLKIIAAVAIFLIGRWVARLISRLFERLLLRSSVDKTLATFIRNLSYYLILVFVIIAAVDKLGVKTTSLVAVLGAAGLAVGLALQGALSNFAAGVLLVLFKPFRVGDFVEAAGTMGSVREISIFHTVLSHPDNRRIILPNSQVTGAKIVNFTAIDKRRVDMVFGISYGDDPGKAKDILLKLVRSDSRILKDPEPVVAVNELADSSVNLICRPWTTPDDYWGVYFDTMEKGKAELERAGITIPFPQRDVHMITGGGGA
jgi:small conductance mechanosensitive channel